MRPMLAVDAPEDLSALQYPVYASPKLDGIRCVIKDGVAVSRTLKPIPNKAVQAALSHPGLTGLDGELIVGSPTVSDVYRNTSSGVMSRNGEPEFTFYAFDLWNTPWQYEDRRCLLQEYQGYNSQFKDGQGRSVIRLHEQKLLRNEKEVFDYEEKMLQEGYEGLILRIPNSPYKYGRSTLKEQYLIKVKRFKDSEATVIGFEELMHNGNEAETDHLGLTKRSSHLANLVPMDTLGALVVKDLTTGVVFKIGTGYNTTHRKFIWNNRAKLMGWAVKYKYFEIGIKDAPRHPVWIGFRNPIDI